MRLENDLRLALHSPEGLGIDYQPLYELRSGRLIGFEALCRWVHPELGVVSPATFIPIAEESGLITSLTERVLREACVRLNAWHAEGAQFAGLTMHVNVAAKDVADPGFVLRVKHALLGAMYLVSGISGSKAADMAAVAPALFPEMKKRGAAEGDLVALLSASGAMSETIPPSLVLITIGAVTGVSIAALFTGGLLPAVVGMVALGVVVYFQSRGEDMGGVHKATGAQIRRALWVVTSLPSWPPA